MDYKTAMLVLAKNYGEKDESRWRINREWLKKWVAHEHIEPLVNRIIEMEEFFPRPATLKRHYEHMIGISANDAFSSLLKAMHRYSEEVSVDFENPRIAEVVRRVWGNWPSFLKTSEPKEFLMKKFVDEYNMLPPMDY